MKTKRTKQVEALARRERDVEFWKGVALSGKTVTEWLSENTSMKRISFKKKSDDPNQKMDAASRDVENLRKKLGFPLSGGGAS